MSLAGISSSTVNNYTGIELERGRNKARSLDVGGFESNYFNNNLVPVIGSELLPTPQARGSKPKPQKIPIISKPGRTLLNSRKKTSVIYTRAKNLKWGRNSARKINEGKDDPGRESMMSARSDVFGVINKKNPMEIQRGKKKDAVEEGGLSPSEINRSGNITYTQGLPISNESNSKKTGSGLAQPVTRIIPFTTPEQTLDIIFASRLRSESVYFSVPVGLSPPFEMYYDFPLNNAQIKDGDIVYFQSFCEEDNSLHLPNEIRSLSPALDKVGIYSAMTITAFSPEKVKMYNLSPDSVLPPNSFKLVEYRGRQNDSNLLLVWHRHRPISEGGSRTAIAEISTEQGRYQLIDKNTGYHFSSDNIRDFIAGVERVSGLTFSDGTAVMHKRGTVIRHAIKSNQQRNFFIEANKTSQTISSTLDLKIDEGNDLFSSFDALNNSKHGLLYRNSFIFENESLHYIDMQGKYGGVNFKKHPTNPSLFQIDDDGSTVLFLREKGILKGYFYTKKEMSDMLTDYGYTDINNIKGISSQEPRLDNFYITYHNV
ncbi:hypothetical protein [Candidatus Pantoea multigeneris]|uniref:Uncharacterized protein n=1 Tax=Candidatus Pantoea multigeneris TaxID=2608357 RepID=A0ABX0RBI7_9GAMM|nr:hypothetical protein [Pantoea multigeneris]NIF20834.1 hypothetical protein [Pantoea multigeneris]